MSSRDEVITFKVNEREKEYAESLAEKMGVNVSEAMRILLFDSRYLYSENVDFSEVNVPAEEIVDEGSSETTLEDSKDRIVDGV